ncbi:MAG: chemotaxis protein CheW [Myxococcota bacterium]
MRPSVTCIARPAKSRSPRCRTCSPRSRSRAASFDLQIEELQRQVSEGTRPMVIVVTVDDVCTCLQVDRVHSVVSFRDAQRSPAPLGSLVTSDGTQLVSQVVKTEKDPRVVQVLDVDNLLTAAPRPAP